MTYREKVLKGLNQHCDGSMFDRCGECPYYKLANKPFECRDELLEDAFALLKEQEAVEPIIDNEGVCLCSVYWCGSCQENLVWHQKYCSNCGRPVKWNE